MKRMDCSSGSTSATASNDKSGKKKKGGAAARLSTDPQSVAARQRRHRISDRFKILQSLVPGGSKMDTVSMLEEAIQYVKFLKTQIWLHQAMINFVDGDHTSQNVVQTNNPTVLPFYYQNVDSCGCQLQGEVAEVGWPESWFSGEENGGFDAYPCQIES